jgi:hypothetical protein
MPRARRAMTDDVRVRPQVAAVLLEPDVERGGPGVHAVLDDHTFRRAPAHEAIHLPVRDERADEVVLGIAIGHRKRATRARIEEAAPEVGPVVVLVEVAACGPVREPRLGGDLDARGLEQVDIGEEPRLVVDPVDDAALAAFVSTPMALIVVHVVSWVTGVTASFESVMNRSTSCDVT